MRESDPFADAQLELACRLGSVDEALEALEDGANINCNGSSPLFMAIMAADRALMAALVEKGADVSLFEVTSTEREEIVEALMQLAPKPKVEETAENGEMEELDAKLVRAFDRMIRTAGLTAPFAKKRAGEYPVFLDALMPIAAEDCHAVVKEFLDFVELARTEVGEEGLPAFFEENAPRLTQLNERYVVASDEENLGDLLKDYLKERKKVA